MRPAPRRVIGYARVSSKEQAIGTSLDDQKEVIGRYAKACGLSVDRMYTESATAVHEKIERREQLQALMSDVRDGDMVLVDKVDRWSRDPELTHRTMRQLVERGASAFFIGDNIDPATSDGDTALNFRILFAREEHKRIKERLVGTRRRLRDRGYYAEGLPPFGYRRQDEKGLAKNVLLVDADEATTLRGAFDMCARGMSLATIGDRTGIDFTRLSKMLRSRVYLGEVRNTAGEWIRGQHDPLVTAAQWSAANEGLASRRLGWTKDAKPGARTAGWWLRDVARCGLCGAKMSASYGQTQVYFGCRAKCGGRYVRNDWAEAACQPLVAARLEELRELLAAPAVAAPPALDLDARRIRLASQKARTLDLFTEGMIDRAELRGRLERLDGERTKLDAMALPPAPSPSAVRALLRAVGVASRAWAKASGSKRREVVRLVVVTVALAHERGPGVTWRTVEELQKEGV